MAQCMPQQIRHKNPITITIHETYLYRLPRLSLLVWASSFIPETITSRASRVQATIIIVILFLVYRVKIGIKWCNEQILPYDYTYYNKNSYPCSIGIERQNKNNPDL